MIYRNIFKTLFVFAAGAAIIASCDSEYNDIGADIIEGDIHHNGMTKYEGRIVAYDKATGEVQSNNLPLNVLGVYDNPAFGKTRAHFVTQLELPVEDPKFSAPEIDSVYLYVPYFSTLEGTDETTGDSTYELDSIYGSEDAEMTLKIYRNNYFLRSIDPSSGTSEPQRYYSNDFALVHGPSTSQLPLAELNNFKFSKNQVKRMVTFNGSPKVAERFAPGIYTLLDNTAIQSAILSAPEGSLVNNNVFKNYFRGIYFNITQNGTASAMVNTRFSEGKIVIIYRDYKVDANGEFDTTSAKIKKTLTLNMKGNTINFFENNYNPGFLTALTPAQTNTTAGDDRLYVKGGDGSMGIISLNQEDLDFLKTEGAIINEANLVFYVDEALMKNEAGTRAPDPLRVYLYDLKNRRPLYDYYADAATSPFNPKYDKGVYGGIVTKGADGVSYKIRLTNHINNIVRKDSTNVPLGLVVSESINIIANAKLKNAFPINDVNVETLPVTSVISPLGTVFYGNNIPVGENYNKRLRLEIFYTKPN